MARTPSTMPPLGIPTPEFALPDPSGRVYTRDQLRTEAGLLVLFLCNHCPFVHHLRDELARLTREYQAKGVGVVGINSNDVERYPEDSPEAMLIEAERAGYTFPYLFDGTQEVARAFGAACTPDFFLHDGEGKLVYRGQFDDSRPGNGVPVTGRDLRAALDALLAGALPLPDQRPSLGCNIKWKEGNAPPLGGAPRGA